MLTMGVDLNLTSDIMLRNGKKGKDLCSASAANPKSILSRGRYLQFSHSEKTEVEQTEGSFNDQNQIAHIGRQ